MKLVVFGLTVTSSWGNGHAALWRALIRALHEAGHHVTFCERDVPYYAENRDLTALPGGGELVLYSAWDTAHMRRLARDADAVLVTSYCPDALAAADLAMAAPGLAGFYDLDTPVTLARLAAGEPVPYIPPHGLADFDIVFSYTGGPALAALRTRLGARHPIPLYGSVDPAAHHPGTPAAAYRADLSYLGTFAADRQAALERLFVQPARARPHARFAIGGAQYPADFPWCPNIFFVRHLPVSEHPAFYAASRVTLNVTRAAMAAMGWCPSGRLFEAAACATAIASDTWPGLAEFYRPGKEILIVRDAADMLEVLALPDADLQAIARRARQRTLAEHTAARRAQQMVDAFASPPAGKGLRPLHPDWGLEAPDPHQFNQAVA